MKVEEKVKIHILHSVTFFPKYGWGTEAADENMAARWTLNN